MTKDQQTTNTFLTTTLSCMQVIMKMVFLSKMSTQFEEKRFKEAHRPPTNLMQPIK